MALVQAAVEEGIVVGGGTALLRLSLKVDAIRDGLDNAEQKVFFLAFSRKWLKYVAEPCIVMACF